MELRRILRRIGVECSCTTQQPDTATQNIPRMFLYNTATRECSENVPVIHSNPTQQPKIFRERNNFKVFRESSKNFPNFKVFPTLK